MRARGRWLQATRRATRAAQGSQIGESALIVEHGFRLLECYPVLGGIGRRLARISFKVEFRHLLRAIHHIALVCKKRLSALSVAP